MVTVCLVRTTRPRRCREKTRSPMRKTWPTETAKACRTGVRRATMPAKATLRKVPVSGLAGSRKRVRGDSLFDRCVRCAGVPVCRCAGVPVCRCAGVPVCRCAGVPVCRCAGVPYFHSNSLSEHIGPAAHTCYAYRNRPIPGLSSGGKSLKNKLTRNEPSAAPEGDAFQISKDEDPAGGEVEAVVQGKG